MVVHLLFFLIALGWQVGFDFKPAEFLQVTLLSGTQGGSPQPAPVVAKPSPISSSAQSIPVRLKEPVKKQTVISKAVTKPAEQKISSNTHPVVPPKRRMLEDEEPQLTSRDEGKLTPDMNSTEPTVRQDDSTLPTTDKPAIAGKSAESNVVNSEYGNGRGGQGNLATGRDGHGNTDQPFTIEGDAAQRMILSQVIPQYPAGLQKEEVVKIRFTVLPDGQIGLMIPMRKGDPTLEKITLDALRQWRFNPLPAGVEQKNVTGIITFRYELE
jgi:TonB family protein